MVRPLRILMRWAHPRSRGEHHLVTVAVPQAPGSSPLARGTQINTDSVVVHLGLIPARAGNTRAHCPAIQLDGAHPRSRGEHLRRMVAMASCWGSSPLARGTHLLRAEGRQRAGLIPARAGNTLQSPCRAHLPRAHPRSRGEHRQSWGRWQVLSGSSPLARGTPPALHGRICACGLIPARAGNTLANLPTCRFVGAHPRSRGEHAGASDVAAARRGSSPLARGTRATDHIEGCEGGLIPARAGNTTWRICIMAVETAHPRSRGEHCKVDALDICRLGSSPLARGTRDTIALDVAPNGLIPARAGNTGGRPSQCCGAWAHPRSRGEHG